VIEALPASIDKLIEEAFPASIVILYYTAFFTSQMVAMV
jgi:hypothetical protein